MNNLTRNLSGLFNNTKAKITSKFLSKSFKLLTDQIFVIIFVINESEQNHNNWNTTLSGFFFPFKANIYARFSNLHGFIVWFFIVKGIKMT